MWGSVAILMTILFVFWVATLDINGGGGTTAKEQAPGVPSLSQIKNEVPSLWQSLKAGVSDLLESSQSSTSTAQEQSQPSAAKTEPLQSEANDQVMPVTLP